MHTWLGYRLFGRAEYPVLKMARVVALGHHERWDGTDRDPIPAPEALDLMDRVRARAFDREIWTQFLRASATRRRRAWRWRGKARPAV